jgi:outer membrane biosynthesis protein TonB
MTLNARRFLSGPLAGLMLLVLSGCTSTFDALPEKMGGLPESAPARPATSYAVPNVYETRPTREAKPLSADEQKKLEADLVTLREQQKNLANPPPPPPPPKVTAKPPSKTPAKASAPKKEAAKTAETKKKEPIVPESGSAPLKPLN